MCVIKLNFKKKNAKNRSSEGLEKNVTILGKKPKVGTEMMKMESSIDDKS